MTEPHDLNREFAEALDAGDLDRIEELWLTALEAPEVDTEQLLEIRRSLWTKGEKGLARTLLELLADGLAERHDHEAALMAVRELVRLTDKPGPELLERLESTVREVRAGCPSLQPVLERYQLTKARHPLSQLEEAERWLNHDHGTIVEVVGQGVGRVVDVNLELDAIKVDVGGRRPVTVQFAGVSRFVKRLPPGDFRRRAVEDPEVLRQQIAEAPADALAGLLESLGEPADVATIKAALDGLLDPESWTSWWTKARKSPRLLTSGSGSRLRYAVGASAEAAVEVQLDELRSTDARQRLTVARRLAARGPAEAAETASFLAGSLADLVGSDPGLAWETTGLLATLPGGSEPAAEWRGRLLATCQPLQLLLGIQDRGEREAALQELRTAAPERWDELWSDWMLHEQHPAVLDMVAGALDKAGQADLLEAALEAIFRNHVEHPAQFVWACEAMTRPDAPAPVRRRMTPSLLEKLPDTLTKSEFGPQRGRAKALLDGGGAAVRVILEVASSQQADRFVNRLQRISTVEPQRARLVEQAAIQRRGATAEVDEPLLVATREAVELKQRELKELLEIEIPKTLKGINAAAAEGDLRENFEYHMLRDRQELQSAKAAKLQRELGIVRVLSPGAADTSQVNIGTVVHLAGGDGNPLLPVTILGSWDADVERRVFANGSELAQRLLGCTVGDEVEVDGVAATISRIEPWPVDG